MSHKIEWVYVCDLEAGDVIVTGNEVMEVDFYVVQSLEHHDKQNYQGYSIINGGNPVYHYVEKPLISGGSGLFDNQVQVIR